MKTFKQFTENTLVQTKGDQYISNSHGGHANPTYGLSASVNYNESTDENLPSWEEYLKKNHNKALGDSPDEHMKNLNSAHPISPQHIDSLKTYTNDSSNVNNHLLESHKNGTKPLDKIGKYTNVKAIGNALNQHKLNHNLVVHSGITFDPEHLKSNKMVTHISTSTSPRTAGTFAENRKVVRIGDENPPKKVLRITIPKGHPAAVIGRAQHNGKDVSAFSNENEVVIPSTDSQEGNKTEMKFHKPEKYIDKFGQQYHVYPTHLVPHKETA